LKDTEKAVLEKALIEIAENGFYYTKSVTNILINALLGNEVKEIDITARMNLNPKTIDNYRNSLFCKTDVKNRVGMVTYAVKNKIYTL
jgi:hypothetical protein